MYFNIRRYLWMYNRIYVSIIENFFVGLIDYKYRVDFLGEQQ